MSTAPAPPLSETSLDLTPGVIALAPAHEAGLATRDCTSCGERAATRMHRVATRVPPWFHLAGAVFFGVGYYGAVSRLWTRGPLGAANHEYHANAVHRTVLLIAPVLVPLCYLGLLAVLGTIVFRARGVSLSVCDACGRRERRTRLLFAAAGPALVAVVTLVLQQASSFALPVLAVGVVLLPFAFARGVLRRLVPGAEGGVALGRMAGGGWLVAVPAAAETVLRRERPGALHVERPLDPRYRWGWVLPLVLVGFAHFALIREVRRQACPYGAVPMSWTQGDQRHAGCMTPLGERHGAWHGTKDGRLAWEASFRFDRRLEETLIRYDDDGKVVRPAP